MHKRDRFSSERGFTSPLAVMVALLVCVALGYAMVRGFSSTPARSRVNARFERGALLDSAVPGVEEEPQPIVDPEEDNKGEEREEPAPEIPEPATGPPEPATGSPQKGARPALPDPETLAKPIEKKDLGGDYLELPFAKISNYRYIFPDVEDGENVPDQIPESIKKLDGRKVSIRGFMLPVTQKDGRVTEFLLLKDQSLCCFGDSAPMVWDIPITTFGKFEVGEVFENGVLMTIYRQRFEKLVKPELAK